MLLVKLPIKGYRSITVKEDLIERLEDHFIRNKSYYENHGINNFNGFIQCKLIETITEKEKLRKLVSKIDTIPEKFLETRTIIKTISV